MENGRLNQSNGVSAIRLRFHRFDCGEEMGGRDPRGRFTKGCPGGPGRPKKRYTAVELRHALLETVTREDIQEIVGGLVVRAKGGDVSAAREVLNRIFGPPVEIDLLERIEALEERLPHAANS